MRFEVSCRPLARAISRDNLLLPACQDLHLRDPREDDPRSQSGVMARQGIVVASFGSDMRTVIPTNCVHLGATVTTIALCDCGGGTCVASPNATWDLVDLRPVNGCNRIPQSQEGSDLGSGPGHLQLMFVLHNSCAVRCKSGSPRPRDATDRTHMSAVWTACDGYLLVSYQLHGRLSGTRPCLASRGHRMR